MEENVEQKTTGRCDTCGEDWPWPVGKKLPSQVWCPGCCAMIIIRKKPLVQKIAPGLCAAQRREVIEHLLTETRLARDVEHHTEKIMERGFNNGRMEARGQFLIQDWEQHDRQDIQEMIRAAVEKTLMSRVGE